MGETHAVLLPYSFHSSSAPTVSFELVSQGTTLFGVVTTLHRMNSDSEPLT